MGFPCYQKVKLSMKSFINWNDIKWRVSPTFWKFTLYHFRKDLQYYLFSLTQRREFLLLWKMLLLKCMLFMLSRSAVSDSLWPPWTVAHQAPMSIGFFRQEYWNGLPFPSPRDLSDPGIKPRFPALQQIFIIWATKVIKIV